MRSLVSYGVLLAGLVGLVAGIGLFTFDYGEGLSYFSTDPRACANCHIMNDQYASWTEGPSPRCGSMHRLPFAACICSEISCESGQWLPAFEGFHAAGLS